MLKFAIDLIPTDLAAESPGRMTEHLKYESTRGFFTVQMGHPRGVGENPSIYESYPVANGLILLTVEVQAAHLYLVHP